MASMIFALIERDPPNTFPRGQWLARPPVSGSGSVRYPVDSAVVKKCAVANWRPEFSVAAARLEQENAVPPRSRSAG